MSTVTIRTATLADVPDLERWDEKPHVRAATSNDGSVAFDADWDDELAPREDGTEFFVAELDGVPIGMLQIIDPATERSHYWGEIETGLRAIDIWIGEENHLGQGHGTVTMRFAIERCFASPEVHAIVIDPLSNNVRAHRFYRRFGFAFVERRVFDDQSDCFVFRLERERWHAIADGERPVGATPSASAAPNRDAIESPEGSNDTGAADSADST